MVSPGTPSQKAIYSLLLKIKPFVCGIFKEVCIPLFSNFSCSHFFFSIGIPSGSQKLQPLNTFRAHTSVVGDVAWHAMHETFFASVGDDKLLIMYV